MTRLRGLALGAILLLAAGTAVVSAMAAGANSEPPDEELPDALERIVTRWHERAWVPGVAVSVRQGDVAWSTAAGYADEQAGIPLRSELPFYIASVTKPFIATTVLSLVDDGLLSMDDPLTAHLPDYQAPAGVTIRHLLAMRSGIPDYTHAYGFTDGLEQDLYERRVRRWAPADLLDLAAQGRPEFPPGERFSYSNTNYILLGEVIRVVTGTPWPEALRQRVLEPLDLRDTLLPTGTETFPIAVGHTDLDRDANRDSLAGRPYATVVTAADAAGGLLSTGDDLTTFASGLFTGQVISRRLVTAMTAVPRIGYEREYGLGVFVQQPDLRTTVYGHTGGGIGYASVLWYVPDHDLAIAVLVNDSVAEPQDLAELLLRRIVREE